MVYIMGHGWWVQGMGKKGGLLLVSVSVSWQVAATTLAQLEAKCTDNKSNRGKVKGDKSLDLWNSNSSSRQVGTYLVPLLPPCELNLARPRSTLDQGTYDAANFVSHVQGIARSSQWGYSCT